MSKRGRGGVIGDEIPFETPVIPVPPWREEPSPSTADFPKVGRVDSRFRGNDVDCSAFGRPAGARLTASSIGFALLRVEWSALSKLIVGSHLRKLSVLLGSARRPFAAPG